MELADALATELGGGAGSTGSLGSGSDLGGIPTISEQDAIDVLQLCLERGKTALAQALYRELCLAARRRVPAGWAASGSSAALLWPAATIQTTSALVLGLCQQLCIVEALQVQGLCLRGELHRYDITSPLPRSV